MIPLPTTYRKNGYDYEIVERRGDVAIAAQKSEGKIIAFEVFEVLKQEAGTRIMGGNEIEIVAKEIMPSTESWGKKAFTVHTLKSALAKTEYLQNRITERVAQREAVKMPFLGSVVA